jgi:DNA repair protein SbcC/Rad50
VLIFEISATSRPSISQGNNLDATAELEKGINHWLNSVAQATEQLRASLFAVAHGERPPMASETLAAVLLELLGGAPAAEDPRCIETKEVASRALALASSVVQRAQFLQSLPLPGAIDAADEKARIAFWREIPETFDEELRVVLAGRFADWRNAGIRDREHDPAHAQGESSSTAQIKRRMSMLMRDIEAAEAAHAEGHLENFTRLMAPIDQALKLGPANAALTHRIDALRREQQRLRDWQRWDDGQRRNQLVTEAQELAGLATKKVSINAHAQAIDTLRERWKELDKLGGTTNKAMWLKFDSALKLAYEPVAGHLEKQKLARQENLTARNQIIDSLVQAAGRFFPAAAQDTATQSRPDWRAVNRALEEARIAWRQLGPVERSVPRKAQTGDKGVITRYDLARQALEGPLKEAHREAMEQRRRFIDAAKSLRESTTARDLVDKVRALQAQWQAHATGLALPRSIETALWTEFKSTIDVIFMERDAARSAKDAELNAHVKAREEIVERLAALASSSDPSQIKRAIADADSAWRASPEVSKVRATQLDKRFQATRELVSKRLGKLAALALQARFDALIAKMALCDEHELAGGLTAELDARWNAITDLPDAWNRKLEARFRGTVHVQPSPQMNSPAYSKSKDDLPETLLHLELACGMESPEEFLAARQQMKLRALKDAMEGRRPVTTTPADIERWLMDAAATPRPDEASRQRLANIIGVLRLR